MASAIQGWDTRVARCQARPLPERVRDLEARSAGRLDARFEVATLSEGRQDLLTSQVGIGPKSHAYAETKRVNCLGGIWAHFARSWMRGKHAHLRNAHFEARRSLYLTLGDTTADHGRVPVISDVSDA